MYKLTQQWLQAENTIMNLQGFETDQY